MTLLLSLFIVDKTKVRHQLWVYTIP